MTGTTTERTSIRATPGGEVVRQLAAGTKIDFNIDIGSWYKVNSVDGKAQAGYINARSVKVDVFIPPPPPPPAGKVVTNIITVYDDGSILVAPQ